jgi:hypothetical protein
MKFTSKVNYFIAGISQRHNDMYYKFIPENRQEIISDIQAFYYHIVKDNFPDKSCKYNCIITGLTDLYIMSIVLISC